MSQFYQFTWPKSTGTEVATSQTTAANTPLILNGSYANQTTGTVNFAANGIVPNITFSSEENVTQNINFIINGYQNGVFISESKTLQNATKTVTSDNYFDVIQSIIPDDVVDKLTVGIGYTGYFPIILLNTAKQNVSTINYALNMVSSDNTIGYTIYLSLENTIGIGKYNDLKTSKVFVKRISSTDLISNYISLTDLGQNILINIDKNSNNSTLNAQFLQL